MQINENTTVIEIAASAFGDFGCRWRYLSLPHATNTDLSKLKAFED